MYISSVSSDNSTSESASGWHIGPLKSAKVGWSTVFLPKRSAAILAYYLCFGARIKMKYYQSFENITLVIHEFDMTRSMRAKKKKIDSYQVIYLFQNSFETPLKFRDISWGNFTIFIGCCKNMIDSIKS